MTLFFHLASRPTGLRQRNVVEFLPQPPDVPCDPLEINGRRVPLVHDATILQPCVQLRPWTGRRRQILMPLQPQSPSVAVLNVFNHFGNAYEGDLRDFPAAIARVTDALCFEVVVLGRSRNYPWAASLVDHSAFVNKPVVGDGVPTSSVHVVPLVGSDSVHASRRVCDARVMNDYSHDTGRTEPRKCSLRRSRMPISA